MAIVFALSNLAQFRALHGWLRSTGKGRGRSFRDEVLDTHKVDRSRFTFTGLRENDEFAATVEAIDLFLYPLQFGSANWGLFELLARSQIVIGSNRCFVPEAITDSENGFLIDYDDLDAWVEKTAQILDAPDRFRHIGDAARQMAERRSIVNTGEQFLDFAERVRSISRGAARPATSP